MKYTYIIIVVVLLAVILVLAYKKSQDENNAENLLVDNTNSNTSINGGSATSTSSSTVVVVSGFAKGDAVTVKSGSAMRRLSDPNIVDYQTTSTQTGWTIEKDLFSGSFKSGSTKATGTWAIISKGVVGFGMTWIPSLNTGVKIYQVVHISRITKA